MRPERRLKRRNGGGGFGRPRSQTDPPTHNSLRPKEALAEVRVLVVGCGGTGSSILGGLPYLHQAMLVQGHPYGLHVTVMDGDTVQDEHSGEKKCQNQGSGCAGDGGDLPGQQQENGQE